MVLSLVFGLLAFWGFIELVNVGAPFPAHAHYPSVVRKRHRKLLCAVFALLVGLWGLAVVAIRALWVH